MLSAILSSTEEELELSESQKRRDMVADALKRGLLSKEQIHREVTKKRIEEDDDEATSTAVGVGFGSALLLGVAYTFGACALVATASIVLRRACLTRGRSLLRRKHLKAEDSPA